MYNIYLIFRTPFGSIRILSKFNIHLYIINLIRIFFII